MSHFRISFGRLTVDSINKSDLFDLKICKIISDKIAVYKNMTFSNLLSLSDENPVEFYIEDKIVLFTFYRKFINSENILVVVQASYRTLKYPNYLSLRFIGKVIVDGIQVNNKGEWFKPEEDLLFEFM